MNHGSVIEAIRHLCSLDVGQMNSIMNLLYPDIIAATSTWQNFKDHLIHNMNISERSAVLLKPFLSPSGNDIFSRLRGFGDCQAWFTNLSTLVAHMGCRCKV